MHHFNAVAGKGGADFCIIYLLSSLVAWVVPGDQSLILILIIYLFINLNLFKLAADNFCKGVSKLMLAAAENCGKQLRCGRLLQLGLYFVCCGSLFESSLTWVVMG